MTVIFQRISRSRRQFLDAINPNSLQVISNARIEPTLINPKNINYQFERIGYFKLDNKMNDSNAITFIHQYHCGFVEPNYQTE